MSVPPFLAAFPQLCPAGPFLFLGSRATKAACGILRIYQGAKKKHIPAYRERERKPVTWPPANSFQPCVIPIFGMLKDAN